LNLLKNSVHLILQVLGIKHQDRILFVRNKKLALVKHTQ
jgi:hypothetical protein